MIRPVAIDNPRSISNTTKIVVGLFAAVLSAFSPDPLLFLFGMTVAILLITMLFNKMEPPVLLFSAVFGWFFFQGQLFNALIRGQQVIFLDYFSPSKPTIIMLGLAAVLFFFIGVFFTSRRKRQLTFDEMKSFFMRVNIQRMMLLYIAFYFVVLSLSSTLWIIPGLAQPIFVMVQFKWALFFLLFTTSVFQNKMKFWLFLVILGDIAMSFFSFFASFKEVIFFSFLSYWVFFFRTSVAAKTIAIFCVFITFYLGAYWSAIKEDYRSFLNRGTGAQEIRVTREEAYSKLLDLIVQVQPQDIDEGFETLVKRLSWIGAFDAVYNHVPKRVPHAGGALWYEGITRPFLPRLIFPNKKALADSKELNYYSGLNVDEKHTSISLSMVAGSYVDFGKWGMMVPVFLFGLFCGWIYKKVIAWGKHPVIGYALSMPMIYLFQINEQSINRIVSSVVLFILAVWFVSRFAVGPFLKFILVPEKQITPLQHYPKSPVNEPLLG